MIAAGLDKESAECPGQAVCSRRLQHPTHHALLILCVVVSCNRQVRFVCSISSPPGVTKLMRDMVVSQHSVNTIQSTRSWMTDYGEYRTS